MYFYNPLPAHLSSLDPHTQYLTAARGKVMFGANQPVNAVDTIAITDATVGRTFVSGDVAFTYFTPPETVTVSQFSMASAGVQSAGLTQGRMGLYTVSGTDLTLVARSASDTSLFNATFTIYTRQFDTTGGYPASYTLNAGERYVFAIILVGSTMPNIYTNGNTAGSVTALSPRLASRLASQTDLPASVAGASLQNIGALHWARIS